MRFSLKGGCQASFKQGFDLVLQPRGEYPLGVGVVCPASVKLSSKMFKSNLQLSQD